jgi:hypothetical protein
MSWCLWQSFCGILVDLRRFAGVFAAERDFLRCRAGQPASPYFVYTFIYELNATEAEMIIDYMLRIEIHGRIYSLRMFDEQAI